MIVDIRYHVVSLVAVFLALGLGMIIGVNMGKTVNTQFEKQIQRLEDTYVRIREDQKVLQTSLQNKENELAITNQFNRAILPTLITNRLLGRRIALVRTNSSVDFKYTKQLINTLRQAGAEVTSVTSFTKPIPWNDLQLKTEIVDAFDLTMTEDKELLNQTSQKIAQIIINGQGSSQLIFLQNKDLLQLWGEYNRGFVDTIIFLGGGQTPESDYQKDVDIPLLDAFRKEKITLVGVEPSFVSQSYMRLYQSKCPSTVDNVDTFQGEVALVFLLTSNKKGHYGVKDTARGLLPEFKLNY